MVLRENLNESTVCGFEKRYKTQIKEVRPRNKSPKKVIVNKLQGCPCLLGDKIDPPDQKYLEASKYKGGVVSSLVAIATTKAQVKRYPLLEKDNIEVGRC